MQFDSSSAWREAVAAVKANREVLFAIAGVFFLLPGLASVLLFSDIQEQIYANMGNRVATEKLMQSGALTPIFLFGLLASVAQMIGYLSMLSILTDRGRPTVGEALRLAVGALPTLIGTALLFFAGYVLATAFFALIVGALAQVAALSPLVFALVGVFVGLLVMAMVRLSLALPTIVMDNLRNPVAVLKRSLDLTRGNGGRLLLFYVILFVVYLVILLLVGTAAGGLAVLIAGKGTAALLISGVISGLIGALASVIFTAILVAIHRQLAGPTAAALGQTFE